MRFETGLHALDAVIVQERVPAGFAVEDAVAVAYLRLFIEEQPTLRTGVFHHAS